MSLTLVKAGNATVPAHRSPLGAACRLPAGSWRSIARSLDLSIRELQIIQGLFEGRDEAAIARRLDISAHTVHTHLARLYRKLEVRNRTGLFLRVFSIYIATGPGTPAGAMSGSK